MPRIGGALKFGEFLLERSGISREALDEALETQRYRPRRVGRLLRDLGHLTQVDLNAQLALFFKPTAETSVLTLASELKARVAKSALRPSTQEWARAQGCELLEEARERLVLLSTTHRDEVLEEAEKQFGASCQILSVSSEELHFIRSEAGLIVGQEAGTLAVEKQATDDQRIEVSAPYTQLFREAILAAKTAQASDIHIQPTRLGVDIRFRVHGDMMTWKTLGEEHRRAFINEVKRLCNLSIATRGKDQDGRVSFQGWQLDLRVSLLPSQHDEKIVLRLLDLTRECDLSQLGFDEQTYGDLMDALQFQKGLILISGPTGSGKTTTLYTLLCALDRKAKNIITLEDPIEYGIEGLTQVQSDAKTRLPGHRGPSWRQDPDVILVGEIRDAETADLCVKAASTGHLVLSTLHANGAAEVISRLTNLGVDPER